MSIALVTGAGARLGRAMAVYLGSRGFDVAVHYASSRKGADEVVAEIKAQGQRATALQADLLNEDDIAGLLPRAAEALGGPVTCLVNNASLFEYDSISTATRDSWDRNVMTNLRAPLVLIQAMAAQGLEPAMDDQGEPQATGLVVNMIDQRVRKLTPHYTTYTVAKMGLWALTRTSAQALAPAIRVNAIGPGPTLIAADQPEEHYRNQRTSTVLKRGSNPSDITGALGFFLDSPGVTGQLLCIDGGQHLGWQTPDVM